MYSYLSVHEDALLCADGRRIVVYDGTACKEIRHGERILYVSSNLFVDSKKDMFEISGDSLEHCNKAAEGGIGDR